MAEDWSSRLVEFRARQIEDPVARLRYLRQAARPASASGGKVRIVRPGRVVAVLCGLLIVVAARNVSDATGHRAAGVHPVRTAAVEGVRPAEVWLVEDNKSYEVYSNGLRIERARTVSTHPRSYVAFDRIGPTLPPTLWSGEPAGIVYHTTESHTAPFEPGQNQKLKKQGSLLLDFVREKRAYNFVIDRFGRVHRIVAEGEVANHAGNSVWADGRRVYVNLNASFLGIAFEGESEDLKENLTPAQIHAGRILTEMLRSRYHIAAENCVVHAQVSVNPDNRRVGYHTDWAADFPYREMGLEDNYALPAPALYLFGFSYDSVFLELTGARLRKGLLHAEERLVEEATVDGRTVAEYKRILQQRYREKLKQIGVKGETE
jgi:hypothetical protein